MARLYKKSRIKGFSFAELKVGYAELKVQNLQKRCVQCSMTFGVAYALHQRSIEFATVA